jgi:V/A-type H+-transporting ATPase subunit I
MQKFQAVILQSARDDVVSQLHEAGIVQLRETTQPEFVRKALSDDYYDIFRLLKKFKEIQSILGPPPLKRLIETKEPPHEQIVKAAKKTIEKLEPKLTVLETRRKEISAEKQKLLAQRDTLKDFLDVEFPLKYLYSTEEFHVHIGRVSEKKIKELHMALEEALSQKVFFGILGKVGEKRTVIIVCRSRDQPKLAPVLYRFEVELLELPQTAAAPKKAMEQLMQQIESLEEQKAQVEREIARLAKRWAPEVARQVEFLEIREERLKACSNFGFTDAAILVEGWVPAKKVAKLESMFTKSTRGKYIFHASDPHADEVQQIPSKFENPPVVRDFEFITGMYGMPRYDEVDPTPFLTISFSVFFGICLGDAGYGALLAIFMMSGFWIAKAFPRDIRRMLAVGGICAIVVGILTGSLFGPTIPAIWSDPTKNPLPLLKLAIVLGILQLFAAFSVLKALKDVFRREWKRIVLEDIARAMIILGFFGLGFCVVGMSLRSFGIDFTFPKMAVIDAFNPMGSAPTIVVVLRILFYVGVVSGIIGGIVLSKGIRSKVGGAINAVYGLIGYIADVASYCRLMALGVATGIIAFMLNFILGMVFDGLVRPNLALSPTVIIAILLLIGMAFVFLVGHSFNIFIGSMGGFVHTMRLHFAEFFGKFYEGGAEKFAPFKAKRVFTKVKGGELSGS